MCISGDEEGRLQGPGAVQEIWPSSQSHLTGTSRPKKAEMPVWQRDPRLFHFAGSQSGVGITNFCCSLNLQFRR